MKDRKLSSKRINANTLLILIIIIFIAIYYGYRSLHRPSQPITKEISTTTLESKKETPKPKPLRESSPEYIKAVLDRFSIVTKDPDIDSIKLDGSILYINFIRSQTFQEYRAVAEMNAWQFSEFKLQKLGVSHVSVFITYNEKLVLSVSASRGKIEPGSLRIY